MRREEFVPFYVHGFFKLYLKLSGNRVQDFKAIWWAERAELCRCLKLVINSIAFLHLSYVQMGYNICVVQRPFIFFCYLVRWKTTVHIAYRTGAIFAFFGWAKSRCGAWDMCNIPFSIMCVSFMLAFIGLKNVKK